MKYIAKTSCVMYLLLSAPIALSQSVDPVPLVALLANPETYSGRQVSTMGVLSHGKLTRLCMDRDSVEYDVALNCVVIQDDDHFRNAVKGQPKAVDRRYVQVIGFFDATSPKPRRYSGVIRDVVVVRQLPL